MARLTSPSIVRQLGSLFEGGSTAGLSDRQLIERFNRRRDEGAFSALVARHGPMVLGVCRQLLADRHLAEDAFQATFLVLALKAHSLRDPDLLGTWLYGVALRTTRKARSRIARQHQHEQGDVMDTLVDSIEPTAPAADQASLDREQAEALHGEIDRLPDAFRSPIVLCYFEGLTLDEAARRLRCPAGTLRSRLARAREKLRRALTRRGVVLPATAMAAALSPRSASASVPHQLCDVTAKAAIRLATRQAVASAATTLAQEVLRAMTNHRLATTLSTLLLVAALASGAGFLTRPPAAGKEPTRTPPVAAAGMAAAIAARDADGPRPAPGKPEDLGRMMVTGRVLGPGDGPVAGATVEVIGRRRAPWLPQKETPVPNIRLGRGTTGADGRFRLDAARTSSLRFLDVHVLASAPGLGMDWVVPDFDAAGPTAEIRLGPEVLIHGKVVDGNGGPVVGAELELSALTRDDHIPRPSNRWDSISGPPADDVLAWPRPVKTDARGRFTFPGVARGMAAYLGFRGPRFAAQGFLHAGTGDEAAPMHIDYTLLPEIVVEGRALADDTGQPIPHAMVTVSSSDRAFIGQGAHFPADERGRYTAHVPPGQNVAIRAYPPDGQPYLAAEHRFERPAGASRLTEIDIRLPRGIPIGGRVTEEKSGRPLAGATVQVFNPRPDVLDGFATIAVSRDDGSFAIAVPPGKGHLFVFGPTPNYILEEIGGRELATGRPGGVRSYAHAIVAFTARHEAAPRELAAVLRPGRAVSGRVVDPAGRPVEEAMILARIDHDSNRTGWTGTPTLGVRKGRFHLFGLDPEHPVPVMFLDAGHEWGATVTLPARPDGRDLTVRLGPCGRARARFVGPDGKPVVRHLFQHEILLLITPGPSGPFLREAIPPGRLAATVELAHIDPEHYLSHHWADAEGRVILPDLIPGAVYRVLDQSTMGVPGKGVQVRGEFTVKAGETRDLGDILIERPSG